MDGPARTDPAMAAAVLETARVGYAVVGEDLTYRWVNPFLAELLGYERDELVGTPVVTHLHPDELPELDLVFEEMISLHRGPGGDIGVPMRVRVRRADDTYVTLEIGTLLVDDPTIGGFVQRYRPLRGQHLVDEALHEMAAGAPLEVILGSLVAAVGELVEGPHEVQIVTGDGDGADPDLPTLRSFPFDAPCRSATVRVVVRRDSDRILLRSTRAAIARIADVIGLAIDRDADLAAVRFAAEHDDLTGLESRARFEARLGAAGPTIGILFVDLDGFKGVNDEHGHATGDAALRAAAERIRVAVRPSDAVARFGGDEFAVLCHDVADPDDLAAIAERIVAAFIPPLVVGGRSLDVGVSVGLAWSAAGSDDPRSLLEEADRALYEAKSLGRRRWAGVGTRASSTTTGTPPRGVSVANPTGRGSAPT